MSESVLSFEQAVLELRRQSEFSELMRDSYLDGDLEHGLKRFLASGEFAEVKRLLGDRLLGARVVDVGAGNGIMSCALALSGAGMVVAVEPDPSNEVGRGAIKRLSGRLPMRVAKGTGEVLPIEDGWGDIVYARQVLHHAADLPSFVRECARVLRPGGIFLACREHVVDDERQLQEFLSSHPVHQLAGCEHAYKLPEYERAIEAAGLTLRLLLRPWESYINTYPQVQNRRDRRNVYRGYLRPRLGRVLSSLLPSLPLVMTHLSRRFIEESDRIPGRLYTFLASKPE